MNRRTFVGALLAMVPGVAVLQQELVARGTIWLENPRISSPLLQAAVQQGKCEVLTVHTLRESFDVMWDQSQGGYTRIICDKETARAIKQLS
jgi:hypothetical protein